MNNLPPPFQNKLHGSVTSILRKKSSCDYMKYGITWHTQITRFLDVFHILELCQLTIIFVVY